MKDCDQKTRNDSAPDKGGFVTGRGFDLSLFPGANPHRRVLDEVVGDRPAYFRGEDGHTGWANTLALKAAGITAETKDPAHGVIERDADGTPSGALREDAIELVEVLLPKPTLNDDVAALRWAVTELHKVGITSIMDAGVDERRLEAYDVLAQEGALPLDVVACVVVDPATPKESLTLAQGLRARFDAASTGRSRLRVRATKIYLDGVLEGETAALLQPYLNHKDPHHTGSINATQAQLNETVALLEGDGFQVHMHVIGDAAVRAALAAYAHARGVHGKTDLRGTLAHLQLIDDADLPRFKALGVSANAQSLWAYPDTYIVDINTPQVGQARVDRMYPWGSLAAAGARVVGGSDWPVSSHNPLDAIEVMVTRKDPRKPSDKALGRTKTRDEALTRDQALHAYTTEGAHLLRQEAVRGVIAVGQRADLAVFDRDLATIPAEELNAATVIMTIKDGAVVFDVAKVTTDATTLAASAAQTNGAP